MGRGVPGPMWTRVQVGGSWRRERGLCWEKAEFVSPQSTGQGTVGRQRPGMSPHLGHSLSQLCAPSGAEILPVPSGELGGGPCVFRGPWELRRVRPRPSQPATPGRLSSWEGNVFSPWHFIEFSRAFYF